jgi:hypothetical protein
MRRFITAFFSTGWLLPFWLSGRLLFDYLWAEVSPRLHGESPVNSFPYEWYSLQAFTVGCVWLGAVVFFWAWRLSSQRSETT